MRKRKTRQQFIVIAVKKVLLKYQYGGPSTQMEKKIEEKKQGKTLNEGQKRRPSMFRPMYIYSPIY